jgi:hypothetical protein
VFCAIVVTVTSRAAIAERIVLVIARDYICGSPLQIKQGHPEETLAQ